MQQITHFKYTLERRSTSIPHLTARQMADRLVARYGNATLDILLETARMHGWNERLNSIGLAVLKPDAPEGEEMAA